jgi:hypothetical protein
VLCIARLGQSVVRSRSRSTSLARRRRLFHRRVALRPAALKVRPEHRQQGSQYGRARTAPHSIIATDTSVGHMCTQTRLCKGAQQVCDCAPAGNTPHTTPLVQIGGREGAHDLLQAHEGGERGRGRGLLLVLVLLLMLLVLLLLVRLLLVLPLLARPC